MSTKTLKGDRKPIVEKLIDLILDSDSDRITNLVPIDITIFVMQLLSWVKLSQQGLVDSGNRFGNIRTNVDLSDLRKIFDDLNSYCNDSIRKNDAFKILFDNDGSEKNYDILKIDDSIKIRNSTISSMIGTINDEGGEDFHFGTLKYNDFYDTRQIPYPKRICDLVLRLTTLDMEDKPSIYIPFTETYDSAYFLSQLSKLPVYTESESSVPYPFLLNILMEDSAIIPKFSNPLYNPCWMEGGQLRKFDITFSQMPNRYDKKIKIKDKFGRYDRGDRFEIAFLESILKQTRQQAFVVVPNDFLSKRFIGDEFKKRIVAGMEEENKHDKVRAEKENVQLVLDGLENGENGSTDDVNDEMAHSSSIVDATEKSLRAVINLPRNIFPFSSIQESLLVFDLVEKSDAVLFIDGALDDPSDQKVGTSRKQRKNVLSKSAIGRIKSAYKLAEQNRMDKHLSSLILRNNLKNTHDLRVSKHIVSEVEQYISEILKHTGKFYLHQLVEIKRPFYIREKEAERDSEKRYNYVTSGDIPSYGFIEESSGKSEIYLSDDDIRYINKKGLLLRPYDILLSIKSPTGLVGLVPEDKEKDWIANPIFVILRAKGDSYRQKKLLSVNLYLFLRSKIAQGLISKMRTGHTLSTIRIDDIVDLPVPVLTPEQQEKLTKNFESEVEQMRNIEETRRDSYRLIFGNDFELFD